MSSILPTERLAPTRLNPRISLIYSLPKVGKTTKLAELESCLIVDTEKGAEALNVMRVPVNSIDGPDLWEEKNGVKVLAATSATKVFNEIMKLGMAEFERTKMKPKPPYKYLAIDTLDKFEDYCEVAATQKYKQTTIGKNFDGKSVLELPQGGGYYHLRNEVLMWVDKWASICEHLILVSHIKEKNLNKGGIDVTVRDISLTGKLGSMVAAKADIIGYVYREPGKPELMISFESYEGSVMGARIPRLAGKKMLFNWEDIFIPETTTQPV